MSLAELGPPSLRPDRSESSRLAWAFAISLALHLLVWCSYQGGKKLGVWERMHLPAWAKAITRVLEKVPKREELKPLTDHEPPLVFVDVSPHQATPEAPRKTAYYSDKNSQAANPDADKDTGVPKIDGTQIQVVRTENVQRSKAFPLQPAPLIQPVEPVQESRPKPTLAPEVQPVEPAEESRPKPTLAPGDLTVGKPDEIPRKDEGQGKEARPRTIVEALARQQQRTGLAGEKMKQEGGVKRRALTSSLDVKATPFGAYDAAIIAAVQNRWYYLLDSRDFARDRTGKVVLEFRLNYDGRITDMKVAENTVDELLCLLCQKAILDPAPFARWPSDMRRLVGADYREVRFAFFYN
jgi:hypothetical protein